MCRRCGVGRATRGLHQQLWRHLLLGLRPGPLELAPGLAPAAMVAVPARALDDRIGTRSETGATRSAAVGAAGAAAGAAVGPRALGAIETLTVVAATVTETETVTVIVTGTGTAIVTGTGTGPGLWGGWKWEGGGRVRVC